jgi:hypothetical protein
VHEPPGPIFVESTEDLLNGVVMNLKIFLSFVGLSLGAVAYAQEDYEDQLESADPLQLAQLPRELTRGLGSPTREQLERDTLTVRLVQQRLNQLGYDAGDEDGRWRRQTQVALEQYQRKQGMAALGWLSQDVLANLGISGYRDVGVPAK